MCGMCEGRGKPVPANLQPRAAASVCCSNLSPDSSPTKWSQRLMKETSLWVGLEWGLPREGPVVLRAPSLPYLGHNPMREKCIPCAQLWKW